MGTVDRPPFGGLPHRRAVAEPPARRPPGLPRHARTRLRRRDARTRTFASQEETWMNYVAIQQYAGAGCAALLRARVRHLRARLAACVQHAALAKPTPTQFGSGRSESIRGCRIDHCPCVWPACAVARLPYASACRSPPASPPNRPKWSRHPPDRQVAVVAENRVIQSGQSNVWSLVQTEFDLFDEGQSQCLLGRLLSRNKTASDCCTWRTRTAMQRAEAPLL